MKGDKIRMHLATDSSHVKLHGLAQKKFLTAERVQFPLSCHEDKLHRVTPNWQLEILEIYKSRL